MSRHAQIEEVDDDPEVSDLTLFNPPPPSQNHTLLDPALFNPSSFLSHHSAPPSSSSQQQQQQRTHYIPASTDPSAYSSYHCLYPVYFDATRTRSEGRRVAKELAVKNPLARTIVDAVMEMGFRNVLEPGKTHPKDWGNPGRVRVLFKGQGGGVVENKFQLYKAVSKYLLSHPTTKNDTLKLRLPDTMMMMYDEANLPEPPAVPRGWKLGEILPLHSPALSGGGVNDDMLKGMMMGMGMGMDSPAAGGGGGAVEKKEKKEKKKKR